MPTPVSTSASSARSSSASRTACSRSVEPLALRGADGDAVAVVGPEDVEERAVGDAVGLVQDEDRRVVGQPELFEDRLDGRDLHLGLGAGGVDDVQEQVGLAGLLERRLERGDQRVRQVADEPDGVGEQDVAAARGTASLRVRVSRVAKSLSSTSTPGVGQGVHQRALAGVGVADERDGRRVAPAGDLALLAGLDLARASP